MSDDSKAEARRALDSAEYYEERATRSEAAAERARNPKSAAAYRDDAADERRIAHGQRLLAAVLDPGDDVLAAASFSDDMWADGHADFDHDPANCRACSDYSVRKVCAALRTIAAAAPATPEPPAAAKGGTA